MGTKLFIGSAGTGKTAAIYREIKKITEAGGKCLLFVPDQSSFETERAIYTAVGARNVSNVTVTSFARCSRRILTEFRLTKPYADDAVKLITMREAIFGLSDSLSYFGTQAGKKSFPTYVLKAVASFKNAGATPDTLRKTLNENLVEGALFEKLSDLTMLYEEYDRLLTETLDDKLDDVSRGAMTAGENDWFEGKNVFFDNFDSFSGTQRKLLKVITEQAENVTICLTTDAEKSRNRRFFCINKTIEQIKSIVPEAKTVSFTEEFRKNGMDEVPLRLIKAPTPYDEAEFVAAEICRLTQDEKIRFRDVLILTAQRREAEAIRSALKRYRVPSFFDFPEPLTGKPAIMFIITVLKATSLETPDLLRFFRSGFARIKYSGGTRPLRAYECSKLENGAASFGLKKSDWEKPFVFDALKRLEPIRDELCGRLSELRKKLDGASDGREMTELLVEYLMHSQDFKSTLLARTKEGGGEGSDELKTDKVLSAEYGRIWEDLTCAFDSLAFCLGGKKIGLSDYISILETVLSGMTVANPPQTLDCVTVGDIERTRKNAPKYVFVCGACEGGVPRKTAPNANFTSAEQEILEESGLEIGGTRLFRYGKELFFAYRALSMAEKRLYISYSWQDFSGSLKEPSYIFSLTGKTPEDTGSFPIDFFVRTPESALAQLAKHYDDKASHELKKAVGDNAFSERLKFAFDAARGNGFEFSLSRETAEKIFRSGEYSATKLQSAFECSFMHFCKYGLGLFDDETQDIDSPATTGNIVHAVLKDVMSTRYIFNNIGETLEPVRKALEKLRPELLLTGAEDYEITARFGFLIPRIQKILMQESGDFKATGFSPEFFEKKVTYRLDELSVGGTADRIDICKKNGKRYARICDYKTGGKNIDFDLILKGLDLQPFLYLFAHCDETGDLPAATGYVQAGRETPARYLSSFSYDEKFQEKNWYNSHKPSVTVVDGNEDFASRYISYNANIKELTGAPRTDFIKLEPMENMNVAELREYIDRKLILPKANDLVSGFIAARPISDGTHTPCSYCRFRFFCNNRNGIFTGGDKAMALDENANGGDE